MTKKSTSLVVVAVALLGSGSEVLMHKRRAGGVHGGLWEFPGGKVEPGEALEMALVRELEEELAIMVQPADLAPVAVAQGEAADGGALVIHLYTCRRWRGDPQCLAGEEMAWFAPAALPSLAMPPLDYPLAEGLIAAMQNISI